MGLDIDAYEHVELVKHMSVEEYRQRKRRFTFRITGEIMPARYTIGTVEITRAHNAPHATLKVWNRGGLAGELTVKWDDASAIAKRLLGVDAPGNPIKSEMHAIDASGERIVFTPPEKETTEENAEAQMAAMQEAEKAKTAMAKATKVVRMYIDVEALVP